MASISQEELAPVPERRSWLQRVTMPEMWASVAIVSMWLAVLFDGIFGPDIWTSSVSGDSARVPSCIVLVLFAYLGTRVVARYGFSNGRPGD